jgi:hypothetical protein
VVSTTERMTERGTLCGYESLSRLMATSGRGCCSAACSHVRFQEVGRGFPETSRQCSTP